MTERTWEEITGQRRLIVQVPCRQCGQPALSLCRSPKGVAIAPHGSRRADAAAAGVWVPGGTQEPAT